MSSRTTVWCAALPDPKIQIAKGKGIGIGHTQENRPLKGMRFESLEQAQAYLDRWEERWADTRIHGTTKRQGRSHVRRRKAALAANYRSNPSAITNTENASFIWTVAVEVEAAYYGFAAR